jgi:small neutral amino acid transporter SnatA (MarC family)
MNLIQNMRDEWPIWAISCAIMALLVIFVWATMAEAEEWQRFAAVHECRVIGRVNGHTDTGIGFGMTGSGQMGTVITTVSTPSKTGYLCNDGVTYWR